MKKGDIYLVNFGKSRNSFEFGKKRPAIIFQTDLLNNAVMNGVYNYFLVIPLSTKEDLLTKNFRFKISAREELKIDSFAVINSICFLDKKFITTKIASLYQDEILEIEKMILKVFDIKGII